VDELIEVKGGERGREGQNLTGTKGVYIGGGGRGKRGIPQKGAIEKRIKGA